MEKAMAPHSSTLAWKIPWTEEPGRLQSLGSLGVRHDWATSLSLSCIGEGNGNPLQCPCLENPRDRGAWWAAVYGVTQSWIRLKWLSSSSSSSNHPYPQHPCISSSHNTSDRINKTHKKVLFCHDNQDKTYRNSPQISFSVSPLIFYFSNLQERDGLPGSLASKELACECKRCKTHGFNP